MMPDRRQNGTQK